MSIYMDNYLKLTIQIPLDYQETLIAQLLDLDFEGFEQFDDHLEAYIPEQRFDDSKRKEFEICLTEIPPNNVSVLNEVIIEPRNWNEEWEQSIKPLHLPPFFIRPTWSPADQPEKTILLEIDPKMAFGTGYHETTRLILDILPDVVIEDADVLDVGTGTGILSIAALKLGAGKAFGFDIDEWSQVNATENATLNKVEDAFTVAEGSFETVEENKKFDLLLANVNRGAILELKNQIVDHVKEGGDIILSGILSKEQEMVKSAEPFVSLTHVKTTSEEEWVAIHYKK
jgi:ribosomal protein L11 methyltransferase